MQTRFHSLNFRRHDHAMLMAARELMTAGHLQPSVAEVAARAGVAERTVFAHYASADALRLAAADDAATRRSILDRLMGDEWQSDALSPESLDRVVRAAVTGRA